MQTIDRAFTVLRALAAHPGTSTLSDVARRSDLPKTTAFRLLSALEAQAAVQQLGGRWALGPGLTSLTHGAAPVGALPELARPDLVELADAVGENASLAIADEDAALYIDTVTVDSSVIVEDWTGQRLPFHASAAGLALISTWTTDELERYAAGGLEPYTASTVTTLDELRRKVDDIETTGVVWTLQEFSDDINGVGAPIVGPEGVAIGAINLYGPDYRFPGSQPPEKITTALLDACARIGARVAG